MKTIKFLTATVALSVASVLLHLLFKVREVTSSPMEALCYVVVLLCLTGALAFTAVAVGDNYKLKIKEK